MITLNVKSPLTVVWINTWHDWWCCVIHDDSLIAISEERLSRKKHWSGYLYALEYVLSTLWLTVQNVDKFVFSSYHKDIPAWYLWKLKALGVNPDKVWSIDHHLSHAYSGYYLSGFDEALIVVIDGLGNNTDTESYYIWKSNKIHKIGGNCSDRSIYRWIWRAYETFTNFIGRPTTDAGKTMWLSSYWTFFWENIKLFDMNDNFEIEALLDGKYDIAAMNFLQKHEQYGLLSLKWQKDKCADVASFIQYHLEETVCSLIEGLVKKTGIRKLCLVGGVALNWLTNQKLIDRGIIDEIYIPPFPCDTWQCVWNALGWLAMQNIYIRQKLDNPYLGRDYSSEEIVDILLKKQEIYPLPYEIKKTKFLIKELEDDALLEQTAQSIVSWKIVGRFQWASELGPRALGHRSILANPTLPWIKDHINSKVKHREPFRPFAWSIPYEDAHKYFDINKESPFMMLIYKVKPEFASKLPAITHVDNTCRLQTVKEVDNNKYYRLLKVLGIKTWFPMVLNTSFNDNNEPIVETPVEALRNLAIWNIDVLVLHNYIITVANDAD